MMVPLRETGCREGAGEKRWYAFTEPLRFAGMNSIRLELEADMPSHETYEVILLAPDEENAYVIPELHADWRGQTRFHLDMDNWLRRGNPQEWDRAAGLVLRRLEEGYERSGMRITGVEALPGHMEIEVYEDETVIDYQYMGFLSQQPHWRTSGPVSGRPGGYAGGAWTLLEGAGSVPGGAESVPGGAGSVPKSAGSQQESEESLAEGKRSRQTPEKAAATIYRTLNVSVEGFQALEFYGTAVPHLQWRARVQVDGGTVTGQWHTGAGKLVKTLLLLPEGCRELTRIVIELRWKERGRTDMPSTLLLYTIAKVKRAKPWADTPQLLPGHLLELPPVSRSLPRSAGTFLMNEAEYALFCREARMGWGREEAGFWKARADELVKLDFTRLSGAILPARYCGADKYAGCLPGLYSPWSLSAHTNMDSGLAWSLKTLTRAYLAAGDPSYGHALGRLLMAVCSIRKWLWVHVGSFPDGAKQDLPFAKEIAVEAAEAYDAVRHLLSERQRDYAIEAILYKGLYPTHDYVRRNPSVLSMNQGLVYATTLGLGVMPLLADRPRLQWLLEDAERWLYRTLEGYLFPDGGCAEGTAYWMYSMEVASRFLAALAKVNRERFRRLAPRGLYRAMEYPLAMLSNSFLDEAGGLARVGVNINDRGSPLFGLKLLACILARHLDSEPARRWLAGQKPELELIGCWPEGVEDGNKGSGHEPLGSRFPVSGFVVSRSGRQFGDFLVLQQNGPHRKGGHTQYDRGALLIECFGEQLGLDSGTISYEDSRSTRLKDTDLHPHTLTINGALRQAAFGRNGEPAAGVLRFLHSPLADYNRADLTHAYPDLSRYERDLFYFRPHLLLCVDRMEADQPFRLSYHINSAGQTVIEGSKVVSAASFGRLVSHFPGATVLPENRSVWPTNNRALNHHASLGFAGEDSCSRRLTGVHEAVLHREAAARVEENREAGLLTIRKRETTIVLAYQVRPEENGNAPVCSDGRYAYVIYERERIAGFGVVDGTYVRVKGLGRTNADAAGFQLTAGRPLCAFVEVRSDGSLILASAAERELELKLGMPPAWSAIQWTVTPYCPGTAAAAPAVSWQTSLQGESPQVSLSLPAGEEETVWQVMGNAESAPRKEDGEGTGVEVIIDGEVFASGTRIPYGRRPRHIEAVLHAGGCPFYPESLAVLLDGAEAGELSEVIWSGNRRTVRVKLDEERLLQGIDASSSAHTLSVRARSMGVEGRQAHAFVQFYTELNSARPAAPPLQLKRQIAGRTVAGSIRPNPNLMTSCYMSGGFPMKVNGVEYGDAVHCEPGWQDGRLAFEAVYELGALRAHQLLAGAWAVDDSAGVDELPGFSIIEGEKKDGEWIQLYKSPPLARYADPVAFRISMSGMKSLRIRVIQGSSILLLHPQFISNRQYSHRSDDQ